MVNPPVPDPTPDEVIDLGAIRWRVAIGLVAAALYVWLFGGTPVSRDYFLNQDIVVLALLTAMLVGSRLWSSRRIPAIKVRPNWAGVAAASAALALLLWGGTYLIMHNYALTRDEHMVLFDAQIFRGGRLAAELTPQWRGLAVALVPAFLLDVPGQVVWASNYLPGNAALRAAFSLVADPALMNPLLAAGGALALHSIGRRLFPDRPGTQATALLLYFTSAQMWAAAMTTYAMTAHMALNLVWLALFLRGGRLGHGGAILVGFVATGLHQIIFHPLFVLPFLEHLRRRGDGRTALVYVAAYVAIGLFWMSYPALVLRSIGVATEAGQSGGGGILDYLQDRVLPLLTTREAEGLFQMVYNLLRFAAWQNLALLPLLAAALPLARRGEGIAGPLYGGALLTLGAVFILLPYQGHGWGYRYVHGLLGSFALLGAMGWERLRRSGQAAEGLLAAGTALTLAIAMPFLLWKAHHYVAPYARVDRMIDGIDADFAIIDTMPPSFAIDSVRNGPKLEGRPIRLSALELSHADAAWLCRRGSVALVDRATMQRLGLGRHLPGGNEFFQLLKRGLEGSRCGVK